MKKVIVTTTINAPTEAVVKYGEKKDWELVVIGDLKTPRDYKLERGIYINPREQSIMYPEFSEIMGWNNDCRRTIGFLYAVKELKADVVATVDDDNIPYDNWGDDLMVGKSVDVRCVNTREPMFDPLSVTNHSELWHRGFPLQLVGRRIPESASTENMEVKIQADLWNGDPDVDAICRITKPGKVKFDKHIPFTSNAPSPFNSQNTFLAAEVLPDYFPFPFIARLCDIWASFYTQAKGHKVVYGNASVEHRRNSHNLITDMKGEYLGYEHGMEIAQNMAALGTVAITSLLPDRTMRAFEAYQRCF